MPPRWMKQVNARSRPLLVALLLLPASPALGQPAGQPDLENPRLERVVVYADRAEATRRATVPCRAGRAELVLPRLPTTLDVRTLRAEASGRARAIGTSHRKVQLTEHRDARTAQLRQQLEALQDRQAALLQEQAGWGQRQRDAQSYASYFRQLAGEEARSDRVDTVRWNQVLEFLSADGLQVRRRQEALAIELRQLRRDMDLIRRQQAHLQPTTTNEALHVTVAVECHGEASPQVSLSYVVPGATWRPEYDLRFTPGQGQRVGPGQAELTVAAVVQQSSGEEWENVQLILSTAKPKLGAEAPYPAALTIYGGPAGKKKVLVDALERRERLAGPGQAAAGTPQQAELEDRGTSFALVLPHRATIHPDGRPYWLPVDVTAAPAEAALLTIPKLRPYVYQVVRLKNPAPYPLLEGRLHSYRKDTFVGDSQLKYKGPGEPLEISLGLDEEVRVERKEVEQQDRSAGFLSSTKHLERSYRIRLTNNSRTKVPVEVRENIPVSKVDDVRIELVRERTTQGYQQDGLRGILSWTRMLEPAQEQTVDLGYTIHLPEDWDVRIR